MKCPWCLKDVGYAGVCAGGLCFYCTAKKHQIEFHNKRVLRDDLFTQLWARIMVWEYVYTRKIDNRVQMTPWVGDFRR